MMKKSLLTIFALTAAGSLLLTGCTTEKPETKADGSIIVQPEGTIALYSTPDISEMPTWTVNKLPKGWAQAEIVVDKTDPNYDEETFNKALAEEVKYFPIIIYNEDKSCYARPSTTFIPSNNSGRGDLYLSKKSFYDEKDLEWYDSSDEKIVTIPTNNNGKLEFYSGIIGHVPSIFGTSDVSSDAQTWFAYRAIDQKFANPNPPKETEKPVLSQEQIDAGMTIVDDMKTPDRKMIIPVYSVEIACKNPESFKKVDIQSLLDSLTINLK